MTLTPTSTWGSCAGPAARSGWGSWVGSWIEPPPWVPPWWGTALGPNESTAPSEASRVLLAGSPGRRHIAPHLWGRLKYLSSPSWDKGTRVHLFSTHCPAAPFDQACTARDTHVTNAWGLYCPRGACSGCGSKQSVIRYTGWSAHKWGSPSASLSSPQNACKQKSKERVSRS